MRRAYCRDCGKFEFRQAFDEHPEWTAPPRESWRDVALGVAVWLLLLAALGAFYLVAWTAVAA